MIDVDAQQLGEDAGQILADVVGVGDAGAVAGDDVEIAVGAELQAAAVVPAVAPFEDDLLRRRSIAGGSPLTVKRDTRDPFGCRSLLWIRESRSR